MSYYKIVFENQKRECPVFKGLRMGKINYFTIKILKIRFFSLKILKIEEEAYRE
jgi:hypothetical protein